MIELSFFSFFESSSTSTLNPKRGKDKECSGCREALTQQKISDSVKEAKIKTEMERKGRRVKERERGGGRG